MRFYSTIRYTALALLGCVAARPTMDDPGLACCVVEGPGVSPSPRCRYQSGFIEGGLVWCYSYYDGDNELTQEDLDVAKCLTNLHFQQLDLCITPSGSMCRGTNSTIKTATIEQHLHLGSNGFSPTYMHKPKKIDTIDGDDSRAVQAALQHFFDAGIRFTPTGKNFADYEDIYPQAMVPLFGRADGHGELINGLIFRSDEKAKC